MSVMAFPNCDADFYYASEKKRRNTRILQKTMCVFLSKHNCRKALLLASTSFNTQSQSQRKGSLH